MGFGHRVSAVLAVAFVSLATEAHASPAFVARARTTTTATAAVDAPHVDVSTVTATRADERCRTCGQPALLARLEALLLSGDDEVQAAAIIRSLGETKTALALPVLRASLVDQPPRIQVAALQAMSELGYPESLPIFLKALSSPDPEVVAAAAEALARHPLRRVRDALRAVAVSQRSLPLAKEAAIRALLAHDTWESRRDAELVLEEDPELSVELHDVVADHPKPCAQCFEPRLTTAMSDLVAAKDPLKRVGALKDIADLRPSARPLGVADAMTGDPVRGVRMAALELVAASTASLAREMLVEYTRDGHAADIQVRAVRFIATSSDALAVDRIEALVLQAHPKLAHVALGALSKRGVHPRHVNASHVVARTSTVASNLRQMALRVMAENAHPATPDMLYDYAFGDDEGLARTSLALLRTHYPELYARAEQNLPSPAAGSVFLVSSRRVRRHRLRSPRPASARVTPSRRCSPRPAASRSAWAPATC